MRRREGDARSTLSRAQFLKGAGAAAGGVLLGGATGWGPAWAGGHGGRGEPKPIPGGVDGAFNPVSANPKWHFSFPGLGFEMATITDFRGSVGGTEVRGTATGSDGSPFWFDCDM